jgi:hypothetical protein
MIENTNSTYCFICSYEDDYIEHQGRSQGRNGKVCRLKTHFVILKKNRLTRAGGGFF